MLPPGAAVQTSVGSFSQQALFAEELNEANERASFFQARVSQLEAELLQPRGRAVEQTKSVPALRVAAPAPGAPQAT